MNIKIYTYDKTTYIFKSIEMGCPDHVFLDVDNAECDFTLTPPPDFEHTWRWINTKWVADRPETVPLEVIQAEVWEEIKATRLAKITSGVYVPSIDKYVHTDADTAAMYAQIGSSILLGTFEEMNWKALDNTFFNMTKDVFKEIQTEMMRQTQRYHAKAEYHRMMMLEVGDPLSYDYQNNWD